MRCRKKMKWDAVIKGSKKKRDGKTNSKNWGCKMNLSTQTGQNEDSWEGTL